MNDPVNNNKNVGSLEIGTFVGGTYRILDFVGQGGMGFVYKVEHLMMAKVMALKVLRSEQVSDAVWRRFRTEAQAIARLDHPNVVRIYDMSQTSDGLPFYTMDLLVGQSLADYLDAYDQLSVNDALPIFRQVCAGLAYAHDRGIIHRDIKPGNIMLIERNAPAGGGAEMFGRGQSVGTAAVKLVDFGIAKLSSLDGSEGQGLTRPGEIFGSPLYMSPEQCSGQALDYRTDMYSVGVTMFQALTGRPPLVGRTAIETTMMHQTEAPPRLSDKDPDTEFPEALEKIVARLLAKSPEHRYESLADVAAQLMALERGEVITTSYNDFGSRDKEERRFKFDNLEPDALDTTGSVTQDTLAAGRIKINRAMLIILSITVLTFLAGTAIVVAELQKSKKTAEYKAALKARLELDRGSEVVAANVLQVATKDHEANEDHLSPEEEENIKAFLKAQKGYYAGGTRKVKLSMGELMVTTFRFPERFSLGLIDYLYMRSSKVAQGRVDIPVTGRLKFEVGAPVRRYPQLLKFFRPDDIRWLVIYNMDYHNDQLAPCIAHLTGLDRFETRAVLLNDTDLVWLDKLSGCTALVLNGTEITAPALARSQIIRHLTVFSAEHLQNPSPVIDVLQHNNMLELCLDYVKLTDADFDRIAKMTTLQRLLLKGNDISDANLAKLSSLQELRELDLDTCQKLTPRALETIKKLKKLTTLTLPFSFLDEKTEAEVRKALPTLRVFK
jgi:serine/threonine protein kinase